MEEYVEQLVRADAEAEGEIDEELEKLLLERVDGPWVDMDKADFAQMRAKFKAY